MSQNSESIPKNSSYPWLDQARQDRTNRTTDLGKRAIDELVNQGQDVTYASVSRKSKEIDPEGKGIHVNTIKNPELHAYYAQHSLSYKKNQARNSRRKARKEVSVTYDFTDIKLDRDVKNVRKRYRQMTKDELIEKLIQAEQFIALNFTDWLSEQFGAFPKD
ncbi:hypothetical protein PP175_08365 [Aneurinibacillus sp. Ricciae_BoGa-3]|uniref:hypothetical protein n=1 Tax=Aneurinibacillus sp. Ricciae_BoGa-3 TaxID=3022697 RepID=UPI002340AFB4|nr:hypothetical protein [Aneurinibacillus sp. Ricciae_BoGa-3]WCK55916.1 hypothetical protein PP175_08365 [Aneurinibacillus sp. Ricciae_BoGa-3]